MATTDVSRRISSSGTKGGPTSVRLGVLWGYPFSLVRRLLVAFVFLLGLCLAGAYILKQPIDPVTILVHLVPLALAVLMAMYVAEVVGVTERPLPPLGLDKLFWSIAAACLVMALGYAILPTYAPSALVACLAPIAAGVCVYGQRKWSEARGDVGEEISAALFASSRKAAARSMAELADSPGVLIRSVVLPNHVTDRSTMAGLPVLRPEEALKRLRREEMRFLVVGEAGSDDLRAILAPCAGAGCIVETVDELVAKAQGRVSLSKSDDIALLNRLSTQANRFNFQRVLDILIVLAAAPIGITLGLITALLVKISSRGPVFYRQTRVGRWAVPFTITKFRTMRADAEKETGPVWATQNDPRITMIGSFLRKTRFDEIPQLWNILRGDMSVVGPRPERPHFVEQLRQKIPLYDARHSVRPGLSGWAQIRYPYGSDIADAEKKLGYELFYILNRSTTFYFAVVLETIKVLLFCRGGR